MSRIRPGLVIGRAHHREVRVLRAMRGDEVVETVPDVPRELLVDMKAELRFRWGHDTRVIVR